jgi:hypothetical protein
METLLPFVIRTSAKIACDVSDTKIRDFIRGAIKEFDRALPELKMLRDIGEHHDVYAVDDPKRFVKKLIVSS